MATARDVRRGTGALHSQGRWEYYVDGQEVTEKEYLHATRSTRRGPVGGHALGCWPQVMESLAVHPDQIQEALQRNKRHGITGVTYNKKGQAVVADRAARAALIKLEGCVDRDGGYTETYSGESPLDRIEGEPIEDLGIWNTAKIRISDEDFKRALEENRGH